MYARLPHFMTAGHFTLSYVCAERVSAAMTKCCPFMEPQETTMPAWRRCASGFPATQETPGKRLLDDRRLSPFPPRKTQSPETYDNTEGCGLPPFRMNPPPSQPDLVATCPSNAYDSLRARDPRKSERKPPTCDHLCKSPPLCVPAENISKLRGDVSSPLDFAPHGLRRIELKDPQHTPEDIRYIDPELDIEPAVECCRIADHAQPAEYPGAPCQATAPSSGSSGDQRPKIPRNRVCEACGVSPTVADRMLEQYADAPVCPERKRLLPCDVEDYTPNALLPHDCKEHRDRPRDRAHGDPEDDQPKDMCGCPCCLAFKPHPPATIATTDLYRTCNLPKRFKYPAWFKGYNAGPQHPLYRTTASEIGRYPPNVHTVPTIYHSVDRSASNAYAKVGPWRDRSLRNTGSLWEAYTYYDFWRPYIPLKGILPKI